ncbi:MAG: anthranilate phosphoribosyltransferase [Myxococcales bacterium]|nr:anthranilate phosphoribosyltransferase [Myxococcales bacterium]
MSVRSAIELAVRGAEIPGPALESAFGEIMEGKASDALIAGLLVALRAKGETIGEIVAVARALRATASVALQVDPRTIDTCGTGGDASGTFNVSTAAAFVVAGAGVPVGKHGNRAASSRAGSIDVLEALGVEVDLPAQISAKILREVGIAAFFARQLYPAMRHVATVRRELGIRTLMNCMGPLLNPLRVRYQLIGVYAQPLVDQLAAALVELGTERSLVVHGSDGLDEITTSGVTHAALVEGGRVRTLRIDALELGIPPPAGRALEGGDPARNALILRGVLEGEPGPRRDIVALNAAAALWVAGAAADLREGLALARQSIDSGAAREKLEQLVRASRQAG